MYQALDCGFAERVAERRNLPFTGLFTATLIDRGGCFVKLAFEIARS